MPDVRAADGVSRSQLDQRLAARPPVRMRRHVRTWLPHGAISRDSWLATTNRSLRPRYAVITLPWP